MAVYGYSIRRIRDKENPSPESRHDRNQIKGYALLRGLTVDKFVFEAPAHAFKLFLNRRRAKKLLEDIKEGDVIIAPAIEQIFFSATDAVKSVNHFNEMGVGLHIASWGDDVLATPHCKNLWSLMQFLASGERRGTRNREEGKPSRSKMRNGQRRGRTPFGYDLENGNLKENDEEQNAIQLMKDLKVDGLGYAAIARQVKDTLGFSFSHMGIKKILEREGATNPSK